MASLLTFPWLMNCAAAAPPPIPRPAAHWPFDGDASERITRLGSTPQQVQFIPGPFGGNDRAAVFNGRDSAIEVPDGAAIRLGKDDFTVAAWIKPVVGGMSMSSLITKYDSRKRRGLNIYLGGGTSGANGAADSRHLHCGIDDDWLGPWKDCGKPDASASLVSCFTVLDGELYCGTAEARSPDKSACVYRYAGGDNWVSCGRLGDNPRHTAVQSLVEHQGRLYAGTGIWDWVEAAGQVTGRSPAAATHVFVYEGGQQWRDLGQVGQGTRVRCLVSFHGELYAGLDVGGAGQCFRYDGTQWIDCGAPDPTGVICFGVWAGDLYAGTKGNIYRFLGGTRWAPVGIKPLGSQEISCLQVFEGHLYAGSAPQGYVLRFDGKTQWTNAGRLGLPAAGRTAPTNQVSTLAVYNGALVAGTLPVAEMYRRKNDAQWDSLDKLAQRRDWKAKTDTSWLRISALTTFDGRLFAGTGAYRGRAIDIDPAGTLGRVYSRQAGLVLSHEKSLEDGWRHLAVIKQDRQLRLYLDGELSQASQTPNGKIFDLTTSEPLRIGAGPHGAFEGALADLQVYDVALTPAQVETLATPPAIP